MASIGFSHVHKVFQAEEAEKVAAELTTQDQEGWTYKLNHDPKGTGKAFIEIYDEDGEFVANY
ncbi:MAG: hypothetical protein V3U02_09205 [Calditrichia bacterium]